MWLGAWSEEEEHYLKLTIGSPVKNAKFGNKTQTKVFLKKKTANS